MATFHVNEVARAVLIMKDAEGNVTNEYDVAGGIQWTSTDPTVAVVGDEDVDPKDAVVNFLALGSCRIEVSFDGRIGPDENRITAAADVDVVPGEAVAGELTLEMVMVPTP